MKTGEAVLIVAVVVGMAAGQIFFKLAALAMPRGEGSSFILWRFINPYFLTALAIYMGTTFLWVWVLRTVPLNLAYPFMALAFFLVPLLSSFFLGEPFGARHLLGNLLIFTGIVVIAW